MGVLFDTIDKQPSEYEMAVLGGLLQVDQPATSADVAKAIGKHQNSVGQALHRLMCKGRVRRHPGKPPTWEVT